MSDTYDEVELMRRVGEGDAQAYRILTQEHLRPVVSYAYRITGNRAEAEDVAQETFLRLWSQAGRWQPRARLSTWLHRIAHNLCVDRLRRHREHSTAYVNGYASSDRPSQLVARKQLAATVENALGQLPERQRAAITLVHYQGLTNSEAAEVLEVGVEAVESLLARARRRLRKLLADLEPRVLSESQEAAQAKGVDHEP